MGKQSESLKHRLMCDRSKKNLEKIALDIGNDEQKFAELMEVFFNGPYRLTHFAAHAISKCCDLHPHLLLPYLGQMINLLDKNVHDSLKRNIVRTLQFIEIPREHWDETVQHCFALLQSKTEAVAIKVFSMTVLANLSVQLPDIKNELQIIIEDQLPYESPAFASRGKKILAFIQRGFSGGSKRLP